VAIVLTSEFTGGDIRASHNDESLTLEFATNSLYEITLLAWYTGVNYEAGKLTSGYRLALVYDLIHTSSGSPLPCLPSESTLVDHVRGVLHNWDSSTYEGLPDDHVAVYVLNKDDHVGDGHVLSVLKAAADAENIILLRGTLCAHVIGFTESWTIERPLYGLSQETFDCPAVGGMTLARFKVNQLTDIWGKPTRNAFQLILHEDNLVSELPFSGTEPDQYQSDLLGGLVSIIAQEFSVTKN